MDYFTLALSAFFFGAQFIFTKLYQTRSKKNTVITSLFLSLIAGFTGMIIYLFVSGFKLHFNLTSFIYALGIAVPYIIITIFGIKAMKVMNVSMYSLFMMLGGAFVPFLFGVLILKEELSICSIIGSICLVLAIVIPLISKKDSNSLPTTIGGIIHGIILFICNGLTGVFNKMHGISSEAVDSFTFGFELNACSFTCSLLLIIIISIIRSKDTELKEEIHGCFKNSLIAFIYSLFAIAGTFCEIVCTKTLPATLIFPFASGGTIIVSSILSLIFYKEKITIKTLIGIILSIISLILIVL